MPKNKQIVVSLHEGCLDPEHPFVKLFQEAKNDAERRAALFHYLTNRTNGDFDCITLDNVRIIDCDCDVDPTSVYPQEHLDPRG